MAKYLIYNFSGELDDISHLFPNDRLATIAAIIQAKGLPVQIWDRGNIDSLTSIGKVRLQEIGNLAFHDTSDTYQALVEAEADAILEHAFDTVLLNLWQGSGFKFSVDLATSLKAKDGSLTIVAIGQKVDWYKEHILNLVPSLDGLMLGLEYDAIGALVEGRSLGSIPNMAVRDNGTIKFTPRTTIDPNGLPRPLYTPAVHRGIEGKLPLYSVSLSNQACMGQCTFCPRPANYGNKIIRKDSDHAASEVEALFHESGVRCFRIADSTPAPGTLTDFANALISRGLHTEDIFISSFARIDISRGEDFQRLREAKIGALFFGIESLDDDSLRRMKKGITFESIRETLTRAREADIFTVGSFIFPAPGETEESRRNLIERLGEIRDVLCSLLALPAGVIPVTEWGQHPAEHGIELHEGYVEKFLIYPFKYLLPFAQWPQAPFSYDLLGKRAKDVTHDDVARPYVEFMEYVKTELKIPYIPDYYWTLAACLHEDSGALTARFVRDMVCGDYEDIKTVIESFCDA